MKKRWDERYKERKELPPVNQTLMDFFHVARGKRALDIACGMGQNALFLAQKGFEVDAMDISSIALQSLKGKDRIYTILADITKYPLLSFHYDLIVCTNFLERSVLKKMQKALKREGILIYETFTYKKRDFNPRYTLQKNELLQHFLDLEIIHYALKKNGEKASLVARKTI